MKKTLLWIVIGLWLIVAIRFLSGLETKDEAKVVEALSQSELRGLTYSVEGAGKLSNVYLLSEERDQLITQLAAELGVTDGYTLLTERKPALTITTLEKSEGNKKTKLSLTTRERSDRQNAVEVENYILMRFEADDDINTLLTGRKLLKNEMQLYGIEGQVYFTLNGSVPGNLDMEERDRLSEQLLDTLDATTVNRHTTDGLYTVYGYSRYLEDSVRVGQDDINFNLAVNYNETRDQTEILFGSPVIQMDY